MRKLHLLLIALTGLLLLFSIAWGLAYLYGSQNRLPDDARAGGIDNGVSAADAAEAVLPRRGASAHAAHDRTHRAVRIT